VPSASSFYRVCVLLALSHLELGSRCLFDRVDVTAGLVAQKSKTDPERNHEITEKEERGEPPETR